MRFDSGPSGRASRLRLLLVLFTAVCSLVKIARNTDANKTADFEKTFIQAIVYNYNTLREYGDEGAAKAAGKIMTKGKDYVVDDGDILLIKAGAAKG